MLELELTKYIRVLQLLSAKCLAGASCGYDRSNTVEDHVSQTLHIDIHEKSTRVTVPETLEIERTYFVPNLIVYRAFPWPTGSKQNGKESVLMMVLVKFKSRLGAYEARWKIGRFFLRGVPGAQRNRMEG